MILIDTNIISTFGKIGRINLLFTLFQVDNLEISKNVFEEVKRAEELKYSYAKEILELVNKKKIKVVSIKNKSDMSTIPPNFGDGERDSLALAKKYKAVFITNERRVINFCQRERIDVIDLNMILRALWKEEIYTKKEVKKLIEEIEKKDNLIITNKEQIFEPSSLETTNHLSQPTLPYLKLQLLPLYTSSYLLSNLLEAATNACKALYYEEFQSLSSFVHILPWV